MTLNLRRTKKYNPRRSSKLMKLNKQRLSDLENTIQSDVKELLTLIKEGTSPNIRAISQKTKTDLLKFGPDMQKIADEIGGAFPKKVSVFLATIDTVLRSQKEDSSSNIHFWVDDAKLQSCYKATHSLEQALLK
ncbi:MAG: hypothetical protein V4489_02335 [Chlamydiota bacterium]